MKTNTFLGRGMKFPPQVNPATGRFLTSENDISVKESIYLILMTNKGERFLRPEFGCRASNYVFSQTDYTSLNIMAMELETDLKNNEPRLSEVHVNLDYTSKPGCLFIDIDYSVAGANTSENMVFPFYLGESPEEESEEYEAVDDDII